MTRPDMSQFNAMLIAGVVALGGLSLGARFSPYVLSIPHHREIGLALYGVAAVFALLSIMLHLKRSASSWKASPASVTISYLFFIIFAVAGIVVHRFAV